MEYNELKEYSAEPSPGLFEKVERKMARRKAARLTAAVAAVTVAATAVLLVAQPGGRTAVDPGRQVAEAHTEAAMPATASPQTEARHTSPTPHASGPAAITAPAAPAESEPTAAPAMSEPTAEPMPVQATQRTLPQQSLPPTVAEPEPINVAEAILPADITADEDSREQATDKVPTKAARDTEYNNLLWAPNMILPTSGDAENGQFRVKASGTVSNFSIRIFNRGGRQVFSSKNIDQGWDATCNGSDVPQGTYVWVATFRDSDGKARREQGSVTVVR